MSGPWEQYQTQAKPWEAYQKKPQADMSFWGRVKDNVVGVDDGVMSTGEVVAAGLNKAGESMTFGLIGDEADARVKSWLPGGGTYEEELARNRQQERDLEENAPLVALGAEIGGALVAPVGALGAVGKGASMLKRVGASAAATGAMSGVYGFAEGEGGMQERLEDAKTDAAAGAAIGAAIPLVGAGVQRIANNRVAKRAIKSTIKDAPTTEQLKAAGRAAYREVEDAGVSINAKAYRDQVDVLVAKLRSEGLDEASNSLTPKSARVVENLKEAGEGANTLPFNTLDTVRKKAGIAAADIGNKADARLGSQIIEGLDDFVKNLSEDQLDFGDLEKLHGTLGKARETWARMSRSQTIDDAIDASQDYLSGGASGIRNQFRRILRSKKLRRGFSKDEIVMMRRVVNGSIPEQILTLAGGGMGQLTTMGVGVGIGGLPGLAIGAGAAAASRKASEAITTKNAEVVRALIASGGIKKLPKSDEGARLVIEQLLRQGSAASIQ